MKILGQILIMVITVSSQTAIAGIPINGKPISFKEAAKQATNVASCNKKFIALIKSASVIDGPPEKTGRKTKVLDVSPGEIGDDQFGPLSDIPTKEELNALVGKKMCASPD